MLEALNVSVEIGGNRLLSDVSIEVRPGEMLVVAGPNGAGKSTLLKALTGEQRPTSGAVWIDGEDISEISAAQLANRRAVVPQASQLQFAFTVREVVGLGVAVPGFGLKSTDSSRAIESAMSRADITHLARRSYTTLSGGERQRVHLARALCQLSAAAHSGRSGLLFLDEPTSSLDLAHQLLILEEARKEAHHGAGVFVVLHDLNLAARFGDRIALLYRGRLVAQGTPIDVLRNDTLSEVFGCNVQVGTLPPGSLPFVLPQACQLSV